MVHAVRDVSLSVGDGEFLVLVGPSGCGKSTILRMIAGLETPSAGSIAIGDRFVHDLEPKDRDVAMVFQNYALYPHMTVEENMAFALRMRKVPKDLARAKVRQAAESLGIAELLSRRPGELSGGQRQRVALGRAMVREPKVFLFDEPLSNLDAKLRVTTRGELKALHQRLRTTTVYVTHDQEEAMTLGDRIVVLCDGSVQQAAPPLEVYQAPANQFVAGFVGTPPINFIAGTIHELDGAGVREVEGGSARGARLAFVESPPGRTAPAQPAPGALVLPLSMEQARAMHDHARRGGKWNVTMGVRPQALRELAPGEAARDALALDVATVEPLGSDMDVAGHTPLGHRVVARLPAHAGVRPGTRLGLGVDVSRAHFFAGGEASARLA